MKSTHPLAALSLAAILLGTGTRAIAGDGHDHGDAAPAATVRRGGKNRVVLDRICAVTRIFEAWSDEPWINHGAAVRVSQVAFGNSAQSASLDGNAVDAVHADLTAAHLEGGFDMTTSARLPSNASASFIGTQKNGPFDIDGPKARAWLRAPNPHGISNFEVVRPWVNGQDITRRPSDRWIVDFDKRTQDDSALSKSHSPMQMSLCAQLGLTCAEIGIARIGGFMVIRGRH